MFTVSEEGKVKYMGDYGPIIFETYLKNSSRENVKYFCKNVSERYGKYKIAKVTFVDNN